MSKKYDTPYPNVTITGVWEYENGNLQTMPLDAKSFDTISKALEVGGRLLVRKRSEDSIKNSLSPEKAPRYFLEFVPAKVVASSKKVSSTNQKAPF